MSDAGPVQMKGYVSEEVRARANEKLAAGGMSFSRWLEIELWDWINAGAGHPESLEDAVHALWGRLDYAAKERVLGRLGVTREGS